MKWLSWIGLVAASAALSVAAVSWLLAGEALVADRDDGSGPQRPFFASGTLEMRELSMTVRGRAVVLPRAASPVSISTSGGVVTSIGEFGDRRIQDGDLLLEMEGEPRFAFDADFDLYRQIVFGDRGRDVNELQLYLVGLGYGLEVDGSFGSETQGALRAFYSDRGYEAPSGAANSEELESGFRKAVVQAEAAFDQASAARDQAAQFVSLASSGAHDAQLAVAAAEASLAAAIDGTAPELDPGHPGGPIDQADLIALRQSELANARDDLEEKKLTLNGLVIELDRSEDMLDSVALERVESVAALADHLALSGPSAVPSHFVRLETPTSFQHVLVRVGDVLAPGAAIFADRSDDPVQLVARIDDQHAESVAEGNLVTVTDVGGVELLGFVEALAVDLSVSEEVEEGLSGDGVPVAIGLFEDGDTLAEERTHAVEIHVAESSQPVLAAPATAVQTAADGSRFVVLLDGEDRASVVRVEVGLVADGWVELTNSDLTAGMRIAVGYALSELPVPSGPSD